MESGGSTGIELGDTGIFIPLPAVIPPNDNAGTALSVITWTLFGVGTTVMAARAFSKIVILKRFALDDILMYLSWASTMIYSVALQVSYHYGLGRHYIYLTVPLSLSLIKWAYVAMAFCIVGPALGRISFAIYLLQIIGRTQHTLKYPLWALIAVQAIFNTAMLGALYGTCGTDILAIATPNVGCFTPSRLFNFTEAVGALNIAADAMLTIAPTILIIKLKTTPRAKVAAIALLSLSSFAMVAVVWRTVEVKTIFAWDNWDFSFSTLIIETDNVILYYVAAAVEQNVIIIAASIPTIAPIYKYLQQRRPSPSMKGFNSTSASSSTTRLSGDSAYIQHNLANALGMNMPRLGNSVTITAGPQAKDSQEHILPLASLPAIKMTTRTKVEYVDVGYEESTTTKY
ncbi:hypothetical protein LTS10_005648 [Elasticomyces elasticus]|nr:hypothetical protein LTS10_005648 [Elasticomyces elasticus]